MADFVQEDYTAIAVSYDCDIQEEYTAIEPDTGNNGDTEEDLIYQNMSYPQAQQQQPRKPSVGKKPKTKPSGDLVSKQLEIFNQLQGGSKPDSERSNQQQGTSKPDLDTTNRVVPLPPGLNTKAAGIIPRLTPGHKDNISEVTAGYSTDDTPEELYAEPRTFMDDPLPLVKFTKFNPDDRNVKNNLVLPDSDDKVSLGAAVLVPVASQQRMSNQFTQFRVPFILLVCFSLSAIINGILVALLFDAAKPEVRTTPAGVPSTGVPVIPTWENIFDEWRRNEGISSGKGFLSNVASLYAGATCTTSVELPISSGPQSLVHRCQYALDGRQQWPTSGRHQRAADDRSVITQWRTNESQPSISIVLPGTHTVMALEVVYGNDTRQLATLGITGDNGTSQTIDLSAVPGITDVPGQISHRALFSPITTTTVNISMTCTNDSQDRQKNLGISAIRVFGYEDSPSFCCTSGLPIHNPAHGKCYFISEPIRNRNGSFRANCTSKGAELLQINSQSECLFLMTHISRDSDAVLPNGQKFWEKCDSKMSQSAPNKTDAIFVCEAESFCENYPMEG